MTAFDFVKNYGWRHAKNVAGGIIVYEDGCSEKSINLTILKNLVESHELVERLGGLDAARNISMYAGDGVHACRRVSQAIADVESCL